MRAAIENLSDLPRDGWVRCAFPKAAIQADLTLWGSATGEADFICDDGRVFRAVRGRTMRDHSVVYRIFAQMKGAERLEGDLVHSGRQQQSWAAHPWVADDVAELIPDVIINHKGQRISGGPPQATLIDASPAHQRWHVKRQIGTSFVLEWWAEFGHLDPVVDCWGKLVWSDRNDPNEAIQTGGIALQTGELYVDHFAKRKGMGLPVASGADWFLNVSGVRNFVDGSGIDFAGHMLAWVSDPAAIPTELDMEEDNGWISWSIRSLAAAHTGRPMVACAIEGWDGEVLAAKNAPRVQQQSVLDAELVQEWGRFEASLDVGGDFYDARPHGVGVNPPGTGAKEDFGALKGAFVVTCGEPKALHMLAYSAYSDLYRPGTSLYDESGNLLDPAAISGWFTWSGYTHYHPGVSPNRLGKTASSFGFPNLGATGWGAYDDQHRSQNNLCAVVALWDDPLAESIVRTMSIPDAGMLLGRVGAPRAAGRLFGAWSQFLLVLESGTERDRFQARVDEKLGNVDRRLSGTNPVKVVGTGSPDPRKQVYYPEGHPNAGQLAPWWSVWEHGLFTVGCYNLYKATLDPAAMQAVHDVCTTVVRHALFQEQGQWYLPDDIWWNNGQPLPASSIGLGSKQMVVSPGIGGTTGWAFCTLLIATEVLTDASDLDRARKAVRHFTGGREAGNRSTAEWWACVKTVSP